MNRRTATILMMGLCLAGPSVAAAQTPINAAKTVTETATIQAIDATTRTITLRSKSGDEDAYAVGPEIKRFEEFKVGDTVKMTYRESLVIMVRKPGDTSPIPAPASNSAVTRGTGALPSGTIAVQDKATVTIKAIDPAIPSVTVTTKDGRTVTRKIDDKKNIEGLKAGDVVDLTYTRALITSIERGQ